jgi:hypothetical protein
MDVSLTAAESAAVRKALQSYLGDLRMEIVDTDNPGYKRELKEERGLLESTLERLDAAVDAASESRVTIVEMWWG